MFVSAFILRYVAADKHWQNLISCLVEECLKTADIVAPVITNESPEGLTADGAQGNVSESSSRSLGRQSDLKV